MATRLTPFVGIEHDGVRYVISTRERRGVGYCTFVNGTFEEENIRRMLAELDHRLGITTLRGMTVLEVGANLGTETVSLLRRHGVGRVVAFEPDAENARFLRANLALNGVHDRAEIHEMALSDVDTTLVLECSAENWGDHRIRVADAPVVDHYKEADRLTVEVPAPRIGSLAEAGELDLDRVDLVWMDAQGHEGHVLAGAQRLLSARIPVMTEYWPYALRRAGGLQRFHDLVARHYDTIVDLRSNRDEPPVAFSAARIEELADRYSDRSSSYSDLLLLPG